MTTLNARAREAWILVEAESEFGFESDEDLTLTVHDVARSLRDEADNTPDPSTEQRLRNLANDLTGGLS